MKDMYKIIIFSALVFSFSACNDSKTRSESANKPTALPVDSTTREASFNFIDACIENSKLTLGEQKAFVFCKCIYSQLQTQNPGMDSVKLNAMLADTARVSKMAANCR